LAHEADFDLGAMRVHPSLSEVETGDERRHLEPRVMQVLVALYHARGSVLSRDDLITACWNGVVVSEDAINRVIGKLRRLAEHGDAGFSIETLPRIGFRLNLDEDHAEDATSSASGERRFPPGWSLMPESWAPPWRSPSCWR
jgi:DNA-binding winged helix-turn-helix (wHTH) protein